MIEIDQITALGAEDSLHLVGDPGGAVAYTMNLSS